MPKITVDIPRQLYDDMMEHVGSDKKFVNQSDAMDEIDRRRGRLKETRRGAR